jgi:hypothetical protein
MLRYEFIAALALAAMAMMCASASANVAIGSLSKLHVRPSAFAAERIGFFDVCRPECRWIGQHKVCKSRCWWR